MKPQQTKVYVIREKSTGTLVKFGSKCGWASKGAAKNAFAFHMRVTYRPHFDSDVGLYESQEAYVIEEIK